MSIEITDLKHRLRQRCKTIREGLGEATRQQASQAICKHLAGWEVVQSADTVLTYMPIRTEVDLRPLLVTFPQKKWLLPRIIPTEGHRMVFHPYDAEHLVQHPFGMAEPAPYLPQIPPAEIQLVLVPGLAFDRCGWRLGYGGGYFDRFLKDFGRLSVGVVYQGLLLESIPFGEHDVPVQWLVTEEKVVPGTLFNQLTKSGAG